MLNWTATAATTFIATNLDDLLILVLLFSQVGPVFRRRHVVAGQVLGFGTLVAISLALGVAGGLAIPAGWLGWLGLVPIALGVRALLHREGESAIEPVLIAGGGRAALAVPALQVAALTIANGGDNIGVYTPLFARSTPPELLSLLVVFILLLGLWLVAGYRLTHRPEIASLAARYGRAVVPFVLIVLGILIIAESL